MRSASCAQLARTMVGSVIDQLHCDLVICGGVVASESSTLLLGSITAMSTTIAAILHTARLCTVHGMIERLPFVQQITIFKPENLRPDHFVVRRQMLTAGRSRQVPKGDAADATLW